MHYLARTVRAQAPLDIRAKSSNIGNQMNPRAKTPLAVEDRHIWYAAGLEGSTG